MEELKTELKQFLIDTLNIEDITVEDIKDDEPIFTEGLGLDSIDALELGVALKKKYGVKFSTENADNRAYFASVSTLADFIQKERSK
ncbi:MAG: acyl carrier protein [Treponema sp.]|nr:acyl carrier protein [Treponema sp.]